MEFADAVSRYRVPCTVSIARRQPTVVFVWEMIGPYHMDRLEATARHLADRADVVGIEIGSKSVVYPWTDRGGDRDVRMRTLFPGLCMADVRPQRAYVALLKAVLEERAQAVFLCHYEDPVILALAITLRILGRCPIVMQESKFDDLPRRLWRELGKTLFYAPYRAALVGGQRTRDYVRLLGIPEERIALGYDTLSLDRIRRLAGSPPAPGGIPWAERDFSIVARFVPPKNLLHAITAYHRYRELAGPAARDLHLCGAGLLENELRAEVARRGLERAVHFHGFLSSEGVAKRLAKTLALLLPSIYEPFGLVVNEAIAMGVPPLLSDACGARDHLVRQGVNGVVVEADNVEGLARAMLVLANNETEWQRLSSNCEVFRMLADCGSFAEGVERTLGTLGILGTAGQDGVLAHSGNG